MNNAVDFARIEPYWKAWWAGEMLDRVAISITAPIDKNAQALPYCEPYFVHTASPAEVVARFETEYNNTFYGGMAVPIFNPNLGPDVFSAFFGADLKFSPDSPGTSWIDWSSPLLKDYSDLSKLKLDKSNPFYRKIVSLTLEAAQRNNGRYCVMPTDLHGGFDALAVLRGGPEVASMELVDHPDGVQAAMKMLYQAWEEVFDDYWDMVKDSQRGTPSWTGTWAPGTMFPVQSDFSCLVSSPMFREFILDELVWEAEHLDYSIYHLDGVECLQHLDAILEIPRLNAIQWVRGARYENKPVSVWFDLYRKIQAKGKAIVVYPQPSEIPGILDNLKPEGLLIHTWAPSVEEAKDILRKLGWD